MSVIDEVVTKIPDWQGRDISIQPLSGGLTNSNFKVQVDDTPYFVRVPGASTDLLAINRDNEVHNSKAAFVAGGGAKGLFYFSENNVMGVEVIHGRTMYKEIPYRPGPTTPTAKTLNKIKKGTSFFRNSGIFPL